MRCLHCGKALPLLKRLSGGEFCSDAHRREYQQEYSQLALSRLQQTRFPAVEDPPRESVDAPRTVSVAGPASGARPTLATAPTPRAETQNGFARVSPAARVAEPLSPTRETPPPVVPRRQPKPEAPPKQETAAPASMAGRLTHKPPVASMRVAAMIAPGDQMFVTAAVPKLPHREVPRVSAGLVHASVVDWDPACDIRESAARAVEARVELRSFVRLAPVVDLRMIVSGPRTLSLANEAVDMPVVDSVSPDAAALWQAPPCDFTGSAIALGEFAAWQFSTTGFEEPRASAPRVEAQVPEGATKPAPQPRKEQSIPNPATQAIPVVLHGIAAGKARPVQVFAPAFLSGLTIHVPKFEALPLRPMMVVAAAGAGAESSKAETAEAVIRPANGKARKADVRILAPEKPAAEKPAIEKQVLPRTEPAPLLHPVPAEPVSVSLAQPVKQFDLGLPQLRLETSNRSIPPQVWKIAAGVAGALTLALGIFLFTGGQNDSQLRPVVAAAATDWIVNFAPDANRQRKISVLRSSANSSDYRVEFESAIQIKALGWVYRARDPKNFYVSKIELQKPGQNPTFVVAHYAVIDGVDQPRAEAPLRVRVPVGGNYKIRFEAAGNRFTTWVQGQKVDEWTDARLKTGGAGLYSEGIEQANLNGVFHVVPLARKK
jgi:hypothetical protein